MPVSEYILSQSDSDIAEITHVCDFLVKFNVKLQMLYSRKIHRSGLRELRVRHASNTHRIFYFTFRTQKFVLLHAILKKIDNIPEDDLNLALDRMEQYIKSHS